MNRAFLLILVIAASPLLSGFGGIANWSQRSACSYSLGVYPAGSGTLTVPSGCPYATLEVWGAGGAGGPANFTSPKYRAGAGGGAGGYGFLSVSTSGGESYSYSVGAGGTGAGGTSTFAGMTATGGAIGPNSGAQAAFGTTSGADYTNTYKQSYGGSDFFGQSTCTTSKAGGISAVYTDFGSATSGGTTAGTNGSAAVTFGFGGGGGGLNCTGPVYGAGGSGASGAVRFTVYPCNMNWENMPDTLLPSTATTSTRSVCGGISSLYIEIPGGAVPGDLEYQKNGGVWTTAGDGTSIAVTTGDTLKFRSYRGDVSYVPQLSKAVLRKNSSTGQIVDTFNWYSNDHGSPY